jgi:hypothetical protein
MISPRQGLHAGAAILIAALGFYGLDAAPVIDPDAPEYRVDLAAAVDRYGRLASFPGKAVVDCPAQDARTAVVLAMGQSNTANETETPRHSRFPGRVLSFYEGRCMEAATPFLGGTGQRGEWLTLLGDELIYSGRYDKVVIAMAAVGGRRIDHFADGDLGDMLSRTAEQITARYHVTHAVWQQGESDHAPATTELPYRRRFQKLVARLRERGVDAPLFVSVSTYCGVIRSWQPNNPVQRALKALPDKRLGLWPGVDSDSFDQTTARFDGCHLSRSGQEAMAKAQAGLIKAYDLETAEKSR